MFLIMFIRFNFFFLNLEKWISNNRELSGTFLKYKRASLSVNFGDLFFVLFQILTI